MVRRFVHQHDGRVVDEDAGEKDFRFLASAQLAHRARSGHVGYVPSGEGLGYAFFDGPVVVQGGEMFFGYLSVRDGGQGLEFVGHSQRLGDRPAVELPEMLRDEVSGLAQDVSSCGRYVPRKDVQQRGFSCAVVSDDRVFRSARNRETDVVEPDVPVRMYIREILNL